MNEWARASSGVPELDRILDDLRMGDNVVWHVDRLDDYMEYVQPYVQECLAQGRKVVYFRFAQHPPVLPEHPDVTVVRLDAALGFETFTADTIHAAQGFGRQTCYVFDSLSHLQETWVTDQMVGAYFKVTCPFLYELDTIAYFCLKRGVHTADTVALIRGTTQVFLNLYPVQDEVVLQPVKVWERYGPRMFLPYLIQAHGKFSPVMDSSLDIWTAGRPILSPLDNWERLLMEAEALRDADETDLEAERQVLGMKRRLVRLLMGRDERILSLAERYLSLVDLIEIRHRMIGTGFIGGKAVGMLLARKIMECADDAPSFASDLQNDSLYVGSDVFQLFLIHNNLWHMHMQVQFGSGDLGVANDLRLRILEGHFPMKILEQFEQALDIFGQTPIIVRSSSLLEDGYGNAFAGKYQSFFCANQGEPEIRLKNFEAAILQVYASTVDVLALQYRRERGLDKMGEQMSILMQRVSGSWQGKYFFPLAGGVGLSYSAYIWNEKMNPADGLIRIVTGLGTRAVDRTEGDYSTIVSPGMPDMPTGHDLERSVGQRMMDVLDLEKNRWCSIPITEGYENISPEDRDVVFSRDMAAEARAKAAGLSLPAVRTVDFGRLFHETGFLADMKRMFHTLEQAYGTPVDVEFTLNRFAGHIRVKIVQCRPLQTYLLSDSVVLPTGIPEEQVLFRLDKGFIGGGRSDFAINTIVLVQPEAYAALTIQERYGVARMLGRINDQMRNMKDRSAMLIAPGRCGTTTPSMGVPVRFSEISHFDCICEQEFATSGMVPELSFGSHFFQDLVESRLFYAALFMDMQHNYHPELILRYPNRLEHYVQNVEKMAQVIHVAELGSSLLLVSNQKTQQALAYLR